MNTSAKKFFITLLAALILFLVIFASLLTVFSYGEQAAIHDEKINYDEYNRTQERIDLANDIVERGEYILYFRHGHREKWIDVAMYDAMEATRELDASELYFKDAVCLSERGSIQIRMMGEFINEMELPIGNVVTSPSCRARQTSEGLFGTVGTIDNVFMHPGPYNEDLDDFRQRVKQTILDLEIVSGKNSIVSAHNNVINAEVFDEAEKDIEFDLEEGGFYVIKNRDGQLVLIDKYHNFNDFNKLLIERPE